MARGQNNQRASSRGAGDQDRAKMIERALDRLDRLVERLRIDAQRFLAGDLPLPPDELRDQIQKELRRVRGAKSRGTVHNFRLGSIEAKLNSHLALLGRRIRAREEGEVRRAAEAAQSKYDAVQGIVVGQSIEPAAAEALYRGLGKSKLDADQFRSYLDRQAQVIRAKTGCSDIQFRIAVQDGKMKLKAKPIRD